MTKRSSILAIPLEELKHSMLSHMQIAGGYTDSIAKCAMKLVDVIDDSDSNRAADELEILAYILAKDLYESVKDRCAKYPEISGVIAALDLGESTDQNIENKNKHLKAVAILFRELGKYTRYEYPPITDANGDTL